MSQKRRLQLNLWFWIFMLRLFVTWVLRYAAHTHRAGLKGRRARGNFFLEGPYDVIHNVIFCKSYVFAYSQRSRLFFPVVENVLTRQMHIQLAARREFMI